MKKDFNDNNLEFENPYLSSDENYKQNKNSEKKSDFNDGYSRFSDDIGNDFDYEVTENLTEEPSLDISEKQSLNSTDFNDDYENNLSDFKSNINNNNNSQQSEYIQNIQYNNNQCDNTQNYHQNPYNQNFQQNNNPNFQQNSYNQNFQQNNNSNQQYNSFQNQQYNQYYYYNRANNQNGQYNQQYNQTNNQSGQYRQPYTSNPVMQVAKRVFDKADKTFAGLSVLVGFFFVWFIFAEMFNFGIGATVCFITTLIMSYAYVSKKKIKIDLLHKIVFALLILLSIPFTIYSNTTALRMNFMVITAGTLYWIYSTGGQTRKRIKNSIGDLFVSWFGYPFMNYGSLFSALFGKEKDKKNGNAKWIILGLIIAIPIVAVTSSLLINGDEMFKAMFSFLFENFFSKILKYVLYAILGLPIAMAFFSSWYTKYTEEQKKNSNNYINSSKSNSYIAPLALMYSIVIPMCVVYFLYLISQVSYFISFIADNLLPNNFTIVDYARNGFFELCIIAVINLVVIALLIGISKRPQGKIANGIKIITIIMSSFTIIFIATAIYKMFMYIQKYGYTPLRINTSIFMIFIFVVFVLVILKQFFDKVNLFKSTLIILLLFLGIFNLIDVDAFVARENIKMYREGQIDWMGYILVSKLDDSAFEYLVPFLEEDNNGLTQVEKYDLNREIKRRQRKYYVDYDLAEHFPSFNINRYKVYNILMNYDAYISEYDYDRDYNDYYNYNDYDNEYTYNYSNDNYL